MADIVRIFETYCTTNSYEFRYGSEGHINLLQGDLDPAQIYVLMFPPERATSPKQRLGGVESINYTGKMFLVKGSDYSQHYFNENGADQSDSKFTINIEPLLTVFTDIAKTLGCDDLDFQIWKHVEAIDVFDANKDGIWIDYTILQRFYG